MNRHKTRRRMGKVGLGSVMSLLAVTSPALAQEAAGTVDPKAKAETREYADEIIVTATRRAESIRSVPFNIQAITGDTLDKIGATRLADFARTIPGLSIQDSGPAGGTKPVMRGLRTGSEAGLAPTTTVYVDEVPIDMPYKGFPLDIRLIDIERFEALRGPQGTLFGGGAIGGTLRYISKKPSTAAFEGRVSTEVSQTRHGGINYNVTGMVNVPVNDKIAMRINAGRFDNDGFVDNIRSGKNNVNSDATNAARVAVLFKPTDKLDIDISYQRQDGRFGEYSMLWEAERPYTIKTANEGGSRYVAELANLTATYHFGWAKLTSSSSYVTERYKSSNDGSTFLRDQLYASFVAPADLPEFTMYSSRDAKSRSFTQEVRLVSDWDGPFDWIVGGYYHRDNAHEVDTEHTPLGFPGQAAFERNVVGALLRDDLEYRYSNDVIRKQKALFGEARYKITDAWQASVGGRWFKSSGTGDFYAIDFWGPGGRTANGLARTTPLDSERSGGKYSEKGSVWKFNTSYDLGNRSLVYLTVAQGFRPGGFNLVSPNTGIPIDKQQFGSDSLVSYEIGGKFSALQNRVYVSSSLYHIDWTDIQTTVRTPLGFSYQGNAGKAVSNGLEIEAEMRDVVAPGLTFNVGYSYVDAKLQQSIVGIGLDGEHMPFVPRHSLSLMADYSTRITGDLKAGVNWLTTFTSNSKADFGLFKPAFGTNGEVITSTRPNANYLPMNSYWLTNLSLRLEAATWTARLFADNLFDKTYKTTRSFQFFNSQYQQSDVLYYVNRPRTVGVEFTKRF